MKKSQLLAIFGIASIVFVFAEIAVAAGWTCDIGDLPICSEFGEGAEQWCEDVDIDWDNPIQGYWFVCNGKNDCPGFVLDNGKCNIIVAYPAVFHKVYCNTTLGPEYLGICVAEGGISEQGIGLNRKCDGTPCTGTVADPVDDEPPYGHDMGQGFVEYLQIKDLRDPW